MTVRNKRSRLVEKLQYITPDGEVYELHDPPFRSVMWYEGDGFAQPVYESARGPFQHGENVLSYRLDPRKLEMIVRHNGCSRDDYWTKRGAFTDFLRYSRTDANNPQPGVLRRILSNGNIRDFDVYLTKVPVFIQPRKWDHFSFQESIEFTAFNPIAYDPTTLAESVVDFSPILAGIEHVEFSFTIPFIFGTSTAEVPATHALTVNYLGNWEEYPTIAVTGPGGDITLAHQQSGAIIELEGYTFGASETIYFNLSYGQKTVVNNLGVSLLGYISSASNLTSFNLLPDPLAAGGVNIINCTVASGNAATTVLLTYKNRYMSVY